MKTIKKVFGVLEAAERILAVIFFIIMFLLFVYQVVMRYFFSPITWIQEAILAAFLWILIFATCFAEQTEENIRFTSFYDGRGEKGKVICDILSSSLVVVTLSIMFPATVDYIIYSLGVQAPTLKMSVGVIFMPFLYLMLSFWIKHFKKIVLNVHKAKTIFRKDGAVK